MNDETSDTPRKPARRSRVFLWFLTSVMLGAAVAVSVIAYWGHGRFHAPGPSEDEITLVVTPGSGLGVIAADLAGAGVIHDPLIFELGVRYIGLATSLRAGEFAFPAGVSPREAAEIIAYGDTVVHRVTFAEGLTTSEILAQLATVENLEGAVPSGIPEGALLPETYHFSLGDTRAGIVRRMQESMAATLSELWKTRQLDLPLESPEEALILASIIEKETGVAAERRRVAGVFINRLKRGMRLQSDPTVVYGLTEGRRDLGRPLTRADTRAPTAYNTYTIDHLPPGPIANPGRAAIAAALNPLETDEYYFVADGTGGHAFARTLAEHNRNVRAWRKVREQQRDTAE